MNAIPHKKPTTRAKPAPVVLTHTIDGKVWTFYFGVNEMIEVEVDQGKSILAVLASCQENLSIVTIRSILMAGLRDPEGNGADLAIAQRFLEELGLKTTAENIATQAARVFEG